MTNIKGTRNWLAALAGAVAFLVYLPSLQSGFVNWDDQFYVYENLHIQTMSPAFFKWVLTSAYFANWLPLTIISYAVDYQILGLNPAMYHFTNIAFHALNTGLFYILSFEIFKAACPEKKDVGWTSCAGTAALVAALLFGLHPMHVESVSWVSERKGVLSSFFFILGAITYLNYVLETKNRRSYYALTLLFFVLAVMSKPMVVSFPVVLLILDWYPLKRFQDVKGTFERAKKAIIEKIPFILASLACAVVVFVSQRNYGAMNTAAGFLWRMVIIVRGYMFYLYKMLLPFGLAPLYPHPTSITLLSLEYAGAFVSFAAIFIVCLFTYKRCRAITATWLYYLITLLPVIGLVQVGTQAAADRYSYLPSAGVFLLAGAGAALLFERLTRPSRIAALVCSIAVFAALSVLTVMQEAVWKESIALWTHEINTVPDRPALAYYNRGIAYEAAGDRVKAVGDFSEAVRLNPKYVDAYAYRGYVYRMLKKTELALKDYDTVLRFDPNYAKAYLNKAVIHIETGRYLEAEKELKLSLGFVPENPYTVYNLGVCYEKLGRKTKAADYFKQAAAMGLKASDVSLKQ
ncbi:MAG: tetratricopeptide repeat protein [Deltaproteobacteria bacterium]|nr:tetratricopeptide repeat protein [Deltaproteobacteria bacterium]